MTIEVHPLTPFLPANGKILFLGSFPPPQAKWSMEFFYPNWINDFWRIQGLIHFGDKGYFEERCTPEVPAVVKIPKVGECVEIHPDSKRYRSMSSLIWWRMPSSSLKGDQNS